MRGYEALLVTEDVTKPVTKAVTVTPVVTGLALAMPRCLECERLLEEVAHLKRELAGKAMTGAERVRAYRERKKV